MCEVTYYADYKLDEYLKKGAESGAELLNFFRENLLGGNDPEELMPHRGRSGFFARNVEETIFSVTTLTLLKEFRLCFLPKMT